MGGRRAGRGEQRADRLAGQRRPPRRRDVSDAGTPAAVAMRAASTLVDMPPVPTPAVPTAADLHAGEVGLAVDLGISRAPRRARGSPS